MPTPTTVITSCTTGIVGIAATVSLVMGCRVVRVLLVLLVIGVMMVRLMMIDDMRAEMGGIGQMGVDRQGCRLSAGVTRAGGDNHDDLRA